MNNEFEKEFDDEVYEDSFYADEEELEDDEDETPEKDEAEAEEEVQTVKVDLSFACDDCDYRWDDVIVRRKDDYDDDSEGVICPMCGSMNVTQI